MTYWVVALSAVIRLMLADQYNADRDKDALPDEPFCH